MAHGRPLSSTPGRAGFKLIEKQLNPPWCCKGLVQIMGAQVENRRTGPSRVVAGLALVLFVIVKGCLCFQAPVVPLRSVSLFPAHRRSSGSCVRKHRNAALAATVTETNCHTATRRHMLAKVLAGGVGLAFQGAQTALAADLEQYNGASPGVFVRRGMERFRRGLVKESIVDFDKAIELDASEAGYLWQRGLSLYYADRFEDASGEQRSLLLSLPSPLPRASFQRNRIKTLTLHILLFAQFNSEGMWR